MSLDNTRCSDLSRLVVAQRDADMAAYDALPPQVREALTNAKYQFSAIAAHDALRRVSQDQLIKIIRETERMIEAETRY